MLIFYNRLIFQLIIILIRILMRNKLLFMNLLLIFSLWNWIICFKNVKFKWILLFTVLYFLDLHMDLLILINLLFNYFNDFWYYFVFLQIFLMIASTLNRITAFYIISHLFKYFKISSFAFWCYNFTIFKKKLSISQFLMLTPLTI